MPTRTASLPFERKPVFRGPMIPPLPHSRAMTVGMLIAELQKFHPESIPVLSDRAGNEFAPVGLVEASSDRLMPNLVGFEMEPGEVDEPHPSKAITAILIPL